MAIMCNKHVWNLCNSSRIAVAVVFLLILDGVGVPVAVGSSTTVVPVVADYIVPIMGLSAILAVGNSVCRSRRQQLGTLSSVPQCHQRCWPWHSSWLDPPERSDEAHKAAIQSLIEREILCGEGQQRRCIQIFVVWMGRPTAAWLQSVHLQSLMVFDVSKF